MVQLHTMGSVTKGMNCQDLLRFMLEKLRSNILLIQQKKKEAVSIQYTESSYSNNCDFALLFANLKLELAGNFTLLSERKMTADIIINFFDFHANLEKTFLC